MQGTSIHHQNNQFLIPLAFSKIGFCAGTKVFEEALNAFKFLGWLKKFGPAQNILGPVRGQGMRLPVSQTLKIKKKSSRYVDSLAKIFLIL